MLITYHRNVIDADQSRSPFSVRLPSCPFVFLSLPFVLTDFLHFRIEHRMTETKTQSVSFEERRAENGARIGGAGLNAEKTLNALSLEMIDLLAGQLAAWAADPGIVLGVLEGAGAKVFSPGAHPPKIP